MANEINIAFGSFALSETNHISVAKIDPQDDKTVNASGVPQADFSIAEEAKRESITINLEGTIVGTDYDDLRSNIDAFKAAIDGKQNFTIDDDRYIVAQVKNFSCPFSTLRTVAKWKISLLCNNPFWLSSTLRTDERTPTSGTGYAITNNGNAPARVKVEITAPGGGISDNIQVENSTKGISFKYRGDVAESEKVVIDNRVDTDDFVVENDGDSDKANFEGDYLILQPGSNTIVYTGTASATVKLSWRDTYL